MQQGGDLRLGEMGVESDLLQGCNTEMQSEQCALRVCLCQCDLS